MRFRLVAALLRGCAALLIVVAIVGAAGPSFSLTPAASASDDGGGDDDQGDDDDRDDDAGESNGRGHGNQGNGKTEKTDKPGERDDDHDRGRGNDDPIVYVTPAANAPTPAATKAPAPAKTGTLRIVALDCAGTPAADDDWAAKCVTPSVRGSYDLDALDGSMTSWHRDLTLESTDNGVLTIKDLPAGRYDLEQTDDDWRRAESDRVDDSGYLVVTGGDVTTVWIYSSATAGK